MQFWRVPSPDVPARPDRPLKAETPKRTPAWGFYFSIRAASIAAGPAPNPIKSSLDVLGALLRRSLYPQHRTFGCAAANAALGRFCCRSPLKLAATRDSPALR